MIIFSMPVDLHIYNKRCIGNLILSRSTTYFVNTNPLESASFSRTVLLPPDISHDAYLTLAVHISLEADVDEAALSWHTLNFTSYRTDQPPIAMSGYVANAAQLNDESTSDAQKFKKEFQTVGRPPVTDHNINDQYMREHSASSVRPVTVYPRAPAVDEHSVAQNIETAGARTAKPGQKEGAYYDEEQKEQGVIGDEPLGRRKPFEQIDAEETSVHPNNPVQ